MFNSNIIKLACRSGCLGLRQKLNWIFSKNLNFDIPSDKKLITMAEVKTHIMNKSGIEMKYFPTPKSRENLLQYEPKLEDLPTRTMKDSFTSAIIPLSNDYVFQDKYISVVGSCRRGRLLEDMDLFAVWVVYQHIWFKGIEKIHLPYVIVTILVDKIDFTDHIPQIDKDIRLSGHVCWVGKSSIEVRVWLEQEVDNEYRKLTSAYFLMACRNATNTKAAFINPLCAEGAEDEKLIKAGEERKERRKRLNEMSLFRATPCPDEQLTIHKIFQNSIKKDILALNQHTLPKDSRWLSSTIQKQAVISFPEHRNAHNKVFGGFLMRNALEISWCCAYMYGCARPTLDHICDIEFKQSVSVSCFIMMTSYVAYTEKNYMQILTVAEVYDLNDIDSWDKNVTSNVFHFTYKISTEVPKIVPSTYHEMMFYLGGKRKFKYATDKEPTI